MAFEKVSGDIPGDLSRLVNTIRDNIQRFQTVAANEAGSRIERRIFTEGQAVSGDIGQYSTRAAYFGKEDFVKKSAFKPRGKRGFKGERVVGSKKEGFRVEKRKPRSMYLERGYSQLREIQGRRNDKVDLNYRGDLQRSMQTGQSGNDIAYGFVSPKEKGKATYNEEHFGKTIFKATPEEIKAAEQKYLQELDIVVRQAFR